MEPSGSLGALLRPVMRQLLGLDTLQSRRDRAKLNGGTQSSCLIRSGILNYIEEGRGNCGVGWWMISLNL